MLYSANLARSRNRSTVAAMVRCHRDPGRIVRLAEILSSAVDEVVIVADERMSGQDIAVLATAKAAGIHRIAHLEPIERSNAFALSLCTSDWILRLDGDEVPSQELLERLRALVGDPRATHYQLAFAWLWPTTDRRLNVRPWWPDFQVRLLRNDPVLFHYSGLTHCALDAAGPHRLIDSPILHLDLVLTSINERRVKVSRYEAQRPGLTSAGLPLNATYYLPEDAQTPLPTAPISEQDARLVRRLLSSNSNATGPVNPLDLSVHLAPEVDRFWSVRPWAGEAFSARLSLPWGQESCNVLTGQDVVHVVVENLGTESWPSSIASWPLVRLAYHLHNEEGALLEFDGARTSFPSVVGPGEKVIVAAVVLLSKPGRYLLDFDIVYENLRWFGCSLKVGVTASDPRAAATEPARYQPPRDAEGLRDIGASMDLSRATLVRDTLRRKLTRRWGRPSQAVVFLTHREDPRILRHFARLRSETARLMPAYLCVHEANLAGARAAKTSLRITPEHAKQLMPNRYVSMLQAKRSFNSGFVDLAFMPALSLAPLSRFDYLWVMEFDVDFGGNWGGFFENVNDENADFLGIRIRRRAEDPQWSHWRWLKVPGSHETHLHALGPILRVSRRLLDAYLHAVEGERWSGHYEALFPIVAMANGFRIADLGSGTFVPDKWQGANYRSEDTGSAMTFTWRPVLRESYFHESAWPADSMLWHPVKPNPPEDG